MKKVVLSKEEKWIIDDMITLLFSLSIKYQGETISKETSNLAKHIYNFFESQCENFDVREV